MRTGRFLLAAAMILLAATLAAGGGLYAYLRAPQGEQDGEVLVRVPSGSSAREVGEILHREGVVRPAWMFSRVLRLSGVHRELKAGEYAFERPIAPLQVMRILHDGRVATVPITLQEGLTLFESAAALAEAGIAPEEALLEAFTDASPIEDLDAAAGSLEGYLFPETYRFARGTDPKEIASSMVSEFRRRFVDPHREAVDSSPLALRRLVTLASLVEKETGVAGERGRIAGVFAERLDRGMLMQCDPTIIYGLKLVGRWDGNIRRSDLAWDHPYNTYVHRGLPPGPIASPGLASLLAALTPERTGELYFVARGDGSHEFSRTLAEHNRNVRRYQLGRRSATRVR